jgi:hypothetical protein
MQNRAIIELRIPHETRPYSLPGRNLTLGGLDPKPILGLLVQKKIEVSVYTRHTSRNLDLNCDKNDLETGG